MKEKYLKFCDYVARACGAFAVLALLLSILVIVELVFERYFFQRAITWQTELVTMLLVASTFIGSAYVLSEKAHVSMEWIYDFLSKKNILRLKIFTSLVSLLFFLILFYFGFLMVEEAFTKNYSTGTVWDPPLWVPYSSMMIGAALMILQYIAEILNLQTKGMLANGSINNCNNRCRFYFDSFIFGNTNCFWFKLCINSSFSCFRRFPNARCFC